ncbi:hypothetical protein H6785_03175 [Candidatus Nomurabacteria bacterium]|nr:hypothetical protein [Candidatus Nomurabacteria bacterium]
MKKTFEIVAALLIVFFMGVVMFQLAGVQFSEDTTELTPDREENVPDENVKAVTDFKLSLEEKVVTEIGQPIEGFEPQMLMQVFPGLQASDFDGVEAVIGVYTYVDGDLNHEIGDVEMIHSAAPAISEVGYETLLDNVTERLNSNPETDNINELVQQLATIKTNEEEIENGGKPTPSPEQPVACTMDAKMCPDGSYVGRVAPNCEFAECSEPAKNVKSVTCSPESKLAQACTMDYRPVCGVTVIQCVTTPCDPIEETYSNGCVACAQGNVDSYTEGSCEGSLELNAR